jgi:hypothetical protein
MIIYNYRTDWRKISSLFFLLIAAVDIGSASFEVERSAVVYSCRRKGSTRIPWWVLLTSLNLGLVCFTISTFLATVLTVVKTINIMRPFDRLNERALKAFLFILPIIYLALSISDIYILKEHIGSETCAVVQYLSSAHYTVGVWTLQYVLDRLYQHINQTSSLKIVSMILLSLQFFVPALIVLLGMVLQMIYVRRAFRESANTQMSTANHVNLTVFLISLLFLLTVSVSSLAMALAWYDIELAPGGYEMWMKYNVPLVNAALFPTILILRKSDLRATYWNYITYMLSLPATVFNEVRHQVQRRRGYTEI